jgi:hypothetical protein
MRPANAATGAVDAPVNPAFPDFSEGGRELHGQRGRHVSGADSVDDGIPNRQQVQILAAAEDALPFAGSTRQARCTAVQSQALDCGQRQQRPEQCLRQRALQWASSQFGP